jgi:hypothetical protein
VPQTVEPDEPARPAAEAAPVGESSAPVPGRAVAGITPDFLRLLYQGARKINPKAAAFVNGSCDVVAWETPRLTLGVYDSHKFVVDKLMAQDSRQVIETAAAELLGSPVQLVCIVIERPPRERPAPAAEPRGGHLVEAARQMGAQPIGKQ